MYSDTNPPTHCPNGHPLGPHRVLVGWSNTRRPPTRSWTCRECDASIYAEPETWVPVNHLDGLRYVPNASKRPHHEGEGA